MEFHEGSCLTRGHILEVGRRRRVTAGRETSSRTLLGDGWRKVRGRGLRSGRPGCFCGAAVKVAGGNGGDLVAEEVDGRVGTQFYDR